MCYFITELFLSVCVFIVLMKDEQPDEVNKYLAIWLFVNGTFTLLKFCYGYALAYKRSPGRTETYRVAL